MSVTLIEPQRAPVRPRETDGRRRRRTLGSLVPFAGLGLYGVLRWGTMLKPAPTGRLLGMLVLAILVAGVGLVPGARRKRFALLVAVLGLIVIIPLSGLPLAWITHLRFAVTCDAIGQGLSGLPNVLVPYSGINVDVRAVIVMGAGVLLLDGALMLAFAPRALGEMRAAVAALPLVVLAIVPAVLARPSVPFVHGVLLFGLLAWIVWGERIQGLGQAAAAGVLAVAALAALIIAPIVDPHHAWIDVEKLTGQVGATSGEQFNWSQTYAPLNLPARERQVFQVQAKTRSYWKAQDLDAFNGHGWVTAADGAGDSLVGVDASSIKRWTQDIRVTITGLRSHDVIAAGAAAAPEHVRGAALPGDSEGTWQLTSALHPGDSYTDSVYTPEPTEAMLQAAGEDYPAEIRSDFLQFSLPAFHLAEVGASVPVPQLVVSASPLHQGGPSTSSAQLAPDELTQILEGSPYAKAYRLARRLAAGAKTPYDVVLAVKRYLARGFTYDADPAPAAFPLESFLFNTKNGYCQQFAGAMALLLRMAGVPARVSAGFTTGTYQAANHDYSVTNIDAHAWVEVWFPHYGWVTFDPTPGQDPALSGTLPPSTAQSLSSAAGATPQHLLRPSQLQTPKTKPAHPKSSGAGHSAAGTHSRPGGGGAVWPWLVAGLVALVLAAAIARFLFSARAAAEDPIAELERAFARGGRPLAPGTTLSGLAHRYREDPDVAAYLAALQDSRYRPANEAAGGPAGSGPGHWRRRGRRALRSKLAIGNGPLGRLRALWALPPAPPPRRAAPLPPDQDPPVGPGDSAGAQDPPDRVLN